MSPLSPLSPVGPSEEEVRGMKIKAMRALLEERGVNYSMCVEKIDLINKILETNHLHQSSPRNASEDNNGYHENKEEDSKS